MKDQGHQPAFRKLECEYRLGRCVRYAGGVLILAWSVAVATAWNLIWTYESSPGQSVTSLPTWPADTRIQRSQERPVLLVFAHPQCPCTRATLGELAIIMSHCQGKVDVRVLFFKPAGSLSTWEQTDLWQAGKAIPGVALLVDRDAAEARRFSVITSGHTLLYDQGGHLMFSGGITSSRGHSGDNLGRSAIIALLTTGQSDCRKTAVFGCCLVEDALSF